MNMKKLFRKLITVGALLLATILPATAQQSATPIIKAIPLLTGYNVLIQTNQATNSLAFNQPTAYGTLFGWTNGPTYGVSNVLYTSYNGQIVYSYNVITNLASGVNTNIIAKDAFQGAELSADVNGDVNANTSLWVMLGNTNFIPLWTTNSAGQTFIPPAGFTNATFTTAYGGWPLAPGGAYPNWMLPVTTNFYPSALIGNVNSASLLTNTVIFTLFRSPGFGMQGGGINGSTLAPTYPILESTPFFSTNISFGSATAPIIASFPLTSTYLQGAKKIFLAVQVTSTYTNTAGILLNQAFITQPQ